MHESRSQISRRNQDMLLSVLDLEEGIEQRKTKKSGVREEENQEKLCYSRGKPRKVRLEIRKTKKSDVRAEENQENKVRAEENQEKRGQS